MRSPHRLLTDCSLGAGPRFYGSSYPVAGSPPRILPVLPVEPVQSAGPDGKGAA